QKKTTLNALLSSRLAAKKIAKKEIAKIHDRGQRTLPLTIAIIKSIPVACAWLGLSTHQIVRSSVTIMAAIPLRMALTSAIGFLDVRRRAWLALRPHCVLVKCFNLAFALTTGAKEVLSLLEPCEP